MPNLYAFVIYFVYLNSISCSNLNKSKNFDKTELITKAKLLSDITSFGLDTKQIRHYPGSAIIFSYKDYTIVNSYKIDRYYKNTELVNATDPEMVRETKRLFFYVYKEKSEIGYYFDSITAIPKSLRVYDNSAEMEIPKLETFVESRTDKATGRETADIFRLIASIKSLD